MCISLLLVSALLHPGDIRNDEQRSYEKASGQAVNVCYSLTCSVIFTANTEIEHEKKEMCQPGGRENLS